MKKYMYISLLLLCGQYTLPGEGGENIELSGERDGEQGERGPEHDGSTTGDTAHAYESTHQLPRKGSSSTSFSQSGYDDAISTSSGESLSLQGDDSSSNQPDKDSQSSKRRESLKEKLKRKAKEAVERVKRTVSSGIDLVTDKVNRMMGKGDAAEEASRKSPVEKPKQLKAPLREQLQDLPEEDQKNPDTQKIVSEYEKLPKKFQPKDLQYALEHMKEGDVIARAIKSGDFSQVKYIKELPEKLQTITANMMGKDISDAEFDKIRENLSPAEFKQVRDAYLKSIVDLQWHLYKEALLKGNAFSSGVVRVIEPDRKMMHMMENYVKFVNPKYDAAGTSRAAIMAKDGFSRSGRMSSHFHGTVEDNRIYGIDVTFDGKYDPNLLPITTKRHILFGRLDDGTTFIKLEQRSTTFNFSDLSGIRHVGDFIETRVEKLRGNTKETKRKEHVSKKIKKAFNAEMDNSIEPELTKEEAAQIKAKGIKGMLDALERRQREGKIGSRNVEKFKETLQQQGYDLKTAQFRKGNEVLLDRRAQLLVGR